MRLFEYAIIQHPTKKQKEEGQSSTIVVPPKTVLAADERTAGIMAGRDIPEALLGQLDRVEVALRPF